KYKIFKIPEINKLTPIDMNHPLISMDSNIFSDPKNILIFFDASYIEKYSLGNIVRFKKDLIFKLLSSNESLVQECIANTLVILRKIVTTSVWNTDINGLHYINCIFDIQKILQTFCSFQSTMREIDEKNSNSIYNPYHVSLLSRRRKTILLNEDFYKLNLNNDKNLQINNVCCILTDTCGKYHVGGSGSCIWKIFREEGRQFVEKFQLNRKIDNRKQNDTIFNQNIIWGKLEYKKLHTLASIEVLENKKNNIFYMMCNAASTYWLYHIKFDDGCEALLGRGNINRQLEYKIDEENKMLAKENNIENVETNNIEDIDENNEMDIDDENIEEDDVYDEKYILEKYRCCNNGKNNTIFIRL
ncbi:hypothetical protein PV328_012383, partial [Microctonus aethiopoides]